VRPNLPLTIEPSVCGGDAAFCQITLTACFIFGRPFVKRFALCYRTVVLSSVYLSCPVCGVGVLWPNGCMDQDETWRGGRSRPRPQYVEWGPSSPKKGHSPQFLAHVYCVQTAGWIKIPLGTEVGLSPGDIVLDGAQLPPPKKGTRRQFSAHVYCGQTVAHLSYCWALVGLFYADLCTFP